MQSWGGTSDAFCTQGRVKKGANPYAILSQAKPPYNKVEYRTPGTYTVTLPAGVITVKVTVAGAGGGGGGGYYRRSQYNGTKIYTGGNGGRGALITQLVNNVSSGTYSLHVGAGGTGGSGVDGNSGNIGGSSYAFNVIANGGTGGANNLAHGTSYGNGGVGGMGGTGRDAGSAGSTGWVIIEYGGDI